MDLLHSNCYKGFLIFVRQWCRYFANGPMQSKLHQPIKITCDIIMNLLLLSKQYTVFRQVRPWRSTKIHRSTSNLGSLPNMTLSSSYFTLSRNDVTYQCMLMMKELTIYSWTFAPRNHRHFGAPGSAPHERTERDYP